MFTAFLSQIERKTRWNSFPGIEIFQFHILKQMNSQWTVALMDRISLHLHHSKTDVVAPFSSVVRFEFARKMHPPLTLHRHPMCAEIIEQFQKCHTNHPVAKFFGECTNLKIQLDRCFRQEKALKRKANFEESKKLRERLQAYRKETALEEST